MEHRTVSLVFNILYQDRKYRKIFGNFYDNNIYI